MNLATPTKAVSLDEVCITSELRKRPARARDVEAENRALIELAGAIADKPDLVLQKLAETAQQLCNAGSAGVSVLEQSGNTEIFRWLAIAGNISPHLGQTILRPHSPCGAVLDREATLLLKEPVQFFPEIAGLSLPVHEVLLVPFYRHGIPIGTVWVVAHRNDLHFDAEDARIITSLAKFAGAALQIQERILAAERAERSQREREEHFRTLMSATSDVVYRMTSDWSEMLPLDGRDFISSNSGPIKNWKQKNIPPVEHDRITQEYSRAIREKNKFELEHQIYRLDGSIGWTFSRAIPVLNEQGEIHEWLGAASDITRRKQAEAELLDMRSRMDAALVAGTIGTWSWDILSDSVFGDASLAEIFSVTPEDVNGGPLAPLVDSIYPADRPRVVEQIERVLKSGDRFESDYRVARPDGSWRWINARGQIERDAQGRAIRLPGVVIDITDRKHAEAELTRVTDESERRKRLYEAILSVTPDFIYVFSLDHRTLYANSALIRMWGGNSLQDVIGKTFLELGYEPWHAEMHCREIDQVRASKASIRGEVPFHGTYGRRIYEYIFVPVLGADGEVEAVAGTTRDVTERKSMEDELRDSDRKKDDFIALLAHELRNPLAPLRNGLQVMRLAGGDVAAIADVRGMMDRQLGHMVRLIDDLLDASRISRNKMELRRGRVLLADIVGSAVEAAKPLMDEAGHTFTLSLPAGPVFLDADLTRLAQVFGNLLNNSTKYTKRGGQIHFGAERENSEVIITVQDTGIGIPADFLPKIFDMFSQVDRSVERSSGGLGIGLALVKGLVEMHSGTVTAASQGGGQGSTFIVRLPVYEAQTSTGQANLDQQTRSRRRVLVVDDNQDGAKSLAMMLKLLGDQVQTAHDGIEAIEAAQSFRPEIILMDIGMPRLNGLEASRRIKAEPWGQEIKIIALTGWGQEQDRERSQAAGCAGHLVKPVDVAALEKMLGQF